MQQQHAAAGRNENDSRCPAVHSVQIDARSDQVGLTSSISCGLLFIPVFQYVQGQAASSYISFGLYFLVAGRRGGPALPGLGPSWEPIRMNVCVTFVDWMDESDERHRSGWASWHCHLYVRRGDDEAGAGEKRKCMSMCMEALGTVGLRVPTAY